jgi:hypothetical protein
MDETGIWLQLQAKRGKEKQVERLLKGSLPWAEQEFGAAAYFVCKMGHGRFGVFLTSKNAEARDAQRRGKIASAYFAAAKELFDPLPIGENVEVIVMKLPGAKSAGRAEFPGSGLAKRPREAPRRKAPFQV